MLRVAAHLLPRAVARDAGGHQRHAGHARGVEAPSAERAADAHGVSAALRLGVAGSGQPAPTAAVLMEAWGCFLPKMADMLFSFLPPHWWGTAPTSGTRLSEPCRSRGRCGFHAGVQG